ncbi:MAG: class I SAM-dependent methyltransferase [Alphaproteobacteria bacterium]
MTSWTEFWGGKHSIYAGPRHVEAHFRRLMADLAAALPHRPGLRVLDYGSGDALGAPSLAARGHRISLYDAAVEVQTRIAQRYEGDPRITVLDEQALASSDGGFDAIIVSSVIQYIPHDALPATIARWHRLLAPGGILVVADVMRPDAGMAEDVADLLGFAWKEGFLPAALLGLARTFFSDYRRMRRKLGLARYTGQEFLSLLGRGGFQAEALPENPGPNRHRLGFRGIKT